MAVQNVTIRLPEKLYDQVRRHAQRTQRSIEEEATALKPSIAVAPIARRPNRSSVQR
ncbi:MAG: ribbon-helix-helix protein, CopG family [Anaerolineae bacterium]|jgi:hypothetical protein